MWGLQRSQLSNWFLYCHYQIDSCFVISRLSVLPLCILFHFTNIQKCYGHNIRSMSTTDQRTRKETPTETMRSRHACTIFRYISCTIIPYRGEPPCCNYCMLGDTHPAHILIEYLIRFQRIISCTWLCIMGCGAYNEVKILWRFVVWAGSRGYILLYF